MEHAKREGLNREIRCWNVVCIRFRDFHLKVASVMGDSVSFSWRFTIGGFQFAIPLSALRFVAREIAGWTV